MWLLYSAGATPTVLQRRGIAFDYLGQWVQQLLPYIGALHRLESISGKKD